MNPTDKRSQRGAGSLILIIVTLLAGMLLGALLYHGLKNNLPATTPGTVESAREILYWVAPMDADYQRDKPGKSPMGMDLIPVYAEESSAESGPGTIRINPEVVNNLGVRTEKASMRKLDSSLRTVGYIKYDEDHLIHIHPRVVGWVEELHVKASGDPVIKGQALYSLYSPELVNAQEELLLALNRNNTRLVRAAEDRLLALHLPPDFIAELKHTGTLRHTVTFHSSQSGVVDKLNIREGFYVKPDTTLMSIGSLENVWLEAEVFERQAALVETGMPATMTLEYMPGSSWQGRVDYIYPTLDESTRTMRLRLRFANQDGRLKPNMFAQVTLRAASETESLVVPREALIRTGQQDRVVLALGNGRFKSVAVTVGRIEEHYAQILAGLEAGDTVVSSAQFLLDSESSKTSDFKRMHIEDAGNGQQEHGHD